MNNKNLFQFSLTAICSVVLAACGSNGGNNPSTVGTPTVPETTQAPTQTVPENINSTPAPTDTDKPVEVASENINVDAQQLKELASETPFLGYKHVNKRKSKFIINNDENGSNPNHADIPVGMNVKNPSPVMDTLVVAEPVSNGEEKVRKVGYLEDLDLRAGTQGQGWEVEIGKHNNLSDEEKKKVEEKIKDALGDNYGIAYGSTGALPSKSAVTNQKNGTFLFKRMDADVDKRYEKNPLKLTPEAGNGNKRYTVHVNKSNTTGLGDSERRSGGHGLMDSIGVLSSLNNTKSSKMAVDKDDDTTNYFAYHYQLNRSNYTDETFKHGEMAVPTFDATTKELTGYKYVTVPTTDYSEEDKLGSENLARKSRTDLNENAELASSKLLDRNEDADLSQNVAEIYGYRSFPQGGNGYTIGEKVNDFKLNNLPLENAQLQHVQYGRVTSFLSGSKSFNEFRRGLDTDGIDNGLDTYVVSYGTFGSAGTEDHYFYRGINRSTPEELKKLSANVSGALKYWGHAVSYGLDDKWDGNPVSNSAPTAIGNASVGRFVSGNHAHAAVDLATGKVEGAIYNTWYNQEIADAAKKAGNNDPKAGIYPVDLVRFNGLLASNGNITGTAVYRKNGTEGLFGATLYGSDAREMGGVVASHDKNENNKWGAVFGAIRYGSGNGIGNATNVSGQ